MPADLLDLYTRSTQISSDQAENYRLWLEALKTLAREGDLLAYILYVHGESDPSIVSFCFSKHAYVMASHLESGNQTVMVSHPGSGKTLIHRSEMEMWIGMETEKCFADPSHTVPSAVYVMATYENQAEAQVQMIGKTIEYSKRYRELFPNARPDKKSGWERGKFFVKRPPGRDRPEATLMGSGVGGDIQGLRFGKGTVDDPIDQKKAKSDTYVRDTVRWLLATFERRVDVGDQIKRYVFTRWHTKDAFVPLSKVSKTLVAPVYGFWDAHPEYGYKADTLWPDKWPKAKVEEERQKYLDAGEAYLFPLVWMCNPEVASGDMFKRDWIIYGALDEAKDEAVMV